MAPDLAAFLAVWIRGLQLAAQSICLGGIVFTLGLAQPMAERLRNGPRIRALGQRGLRIFGLALAIIALGSAVFSISQMISVLGLTLGQAEGADVVLWSMVITAGALAVAWADRPLTLVLAGMVVLAGSVMTGHPAARMDHRPLIMVADALHQAGVGGWIGGIPYLLMALSQSEGTAERLLVGRRFSLIAGLSVAVLLIGATGLGLSLIGSWAALLGTAYGAMTLSKVGLLMVLLLLGGMNFLAVRGGDNLRLRRFAEVEIGLGISVMFIAASLASQPPAIDEIAANRASLSEIAERLTPTPPRFTSPPHAAIEASNGVGDVDRAWSEFNHHWAGIFVVTMGMLALADQGGWRPARHWPLLFLGLAVMLLVRSDPETWPLGPIPFWQGMRDPEVMQHRLLTLVVAAFGAFEWGIRTGRLTRHPGTALVFPILCAVAGALLLTHSHSLTDIKQRYLIELTHIPMGFLGMLAGWARWLELRAEGPSARIGGWVWPVCFLLIGLLLLGYRER